MYIAQTMPDTKNTQAYQQKQKDYRLCEEGYVKKVFVKVNALIGDSEKFLVEAGGCSIHEAAALQGLCSFKSAKWSSQSCKL